MPRFSNPQKLRAPWLPDVHHGEVIEHGNRQSVIRQQAAEKMIACLQNVSRTLVAEVGILRSEKSEQDSASVEDITFLRSELATAWQGSHTGELERLRAESRSTISIATSH